jgi:hypothetical protein
MEIDACGSVECFPIADAILRGVAQSVEVILGTQLKKNHPIRKLVERTNEWLRQAPSALRAENG